MPAPGYRTFYRIVLTDPPTERDMMSYEALGVPLRRDDPESVWLAQGISVYNTAQQASNVATDFPWLGNYVAELRIPEESSVIIARTTTARGQHTIWGAPHAILVFVTEVHPTQDFQ